MSSVPPSAEFSLQALAVHVYATQKYGAALKHQLSEYEKLQEADRIRYEAIRDAATAPDGAHEARAKTLAALREFGNEHPLVVRYAACRDQLGQA